MRILHLVGRSHRRGAELVARELAMELDQLGHDDRLLAVGLGHEGDREPDLRPLVHRVDQRPATLALAAWRLRRELRRDPVDLVLAHGGGAVQTAILGVPRGRTRIVWQRILGAPDAVWGPLRSRWWRIVLGRVDAVVSLTDELAAEVRRLAFSGPIWVVPNARRPERFQLDRDEAADALRGELAVPAGADLIGFVGHLVAQKRPVLAVDLLAELQRRGRVAHLVLAGGGPLADTVKAAVEQRDLVEEVHLVGHRPDVEHVLAGIDLFVLTSRSEGIPGIAIEAQMAGCPVVTFPLGGVDSVVDHGETGIVLETDDLPSMADAVDSLLADRERREAMGERARTRSRRFSMDVVARTYDRHLRTVVGWRPPSGGERRTARGATPGDATSKI